MSLSARRLALPSTSTKREIISISDWSLHVNIICSQIRICISVRYLATTTRGTMTRRNRMTRITMIAKMSFEVGGWATSMRKREIINIRDRSFKLNNTHGFRYEYCGMAWYSGVSCWWLVCLSVKSLISVTVHWTRAYAHEIGPAWGYAWVVVTTFAGWLSVSLSSSYRYSRQSQTRRSLMIIEHIELTVPDLLCHCSRVVASGWIQVKDIIRDSES